jgi:hypothetical protein
MFLSCDKVENCSHLSTLLKNIIKTKLIKRKETTEGYTFGESLLFWVADWLSYVKLLKQEQIHLVMEECSTYICKFGGVLHDAWHNFDPTHLNQQIIDDNVLPNCKLGILDRQVICMDGFSVFLNVETGEKRPTRTKIPIEVITYNLTALFVRYFSNLKKMTHDRTEKGKVEV